MKYNVGDRVRIKDIDWYNRNKNSNGNVVLYTTVPHFSCREKVQTVFTKDMAKFCGKVVTIEIVWSVNYSIVEGTHRDYFTDEMIEGLVEEEAKPKYEDEVNGEYYSTPKYLVRPSGYQFVDENGNVINATKIVLEKKKKEYPKTYEECCKLLRFVDDKPQWHGYRAIQLKTLQKLLICRDAYWKIAGDEMGLGESCWSPDWMNNLQHKHYISTEWDEIRTNFNSTTNKVLAFPTAEMRDAFYENFKKEIKKCKELL